MSARASAFTRTLAILAALVMVATALSAISQGVASSTVSAPAVTITSSPSSAVSSGAPTTSAPSSPVVGSDGQVLTINKALAAAVDRTEQTIVASGGSLANYHPPNLNEGLPPAKTHGVVTPLYIAAPAPMGEAYYGLSNTTGTIQGTSLDTESLAGYWSTTDPTGTAAELFDTSGGNGAAEYGAQLNTVLVNVTLRGQTAFGASSASGNDPDGCPSAGDYVAIAGNLCPNEFWLQNYVQFSEASHSFTISGEIWNFSNPTADWSGMGSSTIEGFGSVEEEEVYQSPSSGTILLPAGPTQEEYTVALYENYTQGPCHLDTTPGSGVPSCGSISTTEPVNEVFLNYTVWNAAGQKVCPTTIPSGRVCGEFDDVFFNSVGPSNPNGVPLYGSPDQEIGSAMMQANGTAYDPLGLTNDFEFDYAIGSDDGATNNIVYTDGSVAVDYCANANAVQAADGSISCQSYSAPPAAVDYGGETGETSTGESVYWAPQGSAAPAEALVPGAATPMAHMTTGPSLLIGLWNMTGSTAPGTAQPYTGSAPYPAYTGGTPFSYANIRPANAWVGIAQESQAPVAGSNVLVSSQEYFQVAPTFGWFSYWTGSGGSPQTTELGSDLYLPSGWYTIEVLLSGYAPVIEQIDVTGSAPVAPSITLQPDWSTGAYTPDWAFSNSDLANLSVSPSNTVPTGAGTSSDPYLISAPAPTVGTVDGVVIGQPGSVSWLFSNLNDYLFTVWIGAFINSTTAVTQFNPAPSFLLNYPSWQLYALEDFNVPSTNGFQYYLLNTQNLAIIGASHIYTWDNSEAQSSIYSIIVNNGANDLIAGNTFALSNRGIDLTGGGTTDTSTINGAPVSFALPPARNTVWGNTFVPTPQTSYTGLVGFVADDALVVGEAYDRVYNNDFAANGTVNATASATSALDLTMWNVTCVAGYSALASGYYPGAAVCEPLSYSQTLDGFTMAGSIAGSSYQGGNEWSSYGNVANPYGNVPFKNHLTSETGTAEIAATAVGFAGDYAPLITTSVYDVAVAETGLPSATTSTEFEAAVFSGTTPVGFNDTQTTTPTATCGGDPCLNFYLPSGTYTVRGYSSSANGADPATYLFAVTATALGLVNIFSFAPSYSVTFTETGLPSGTIWTESVAGQLAVTSTSTTHVFSLPDGTYTFQTSPLPAGHTTTSAGYSGSFTVSGATVAESVPFYAALTAPAAPAVSASPLDANQPLTVTATIPSTGVPTYSYLWWVSVDGGYFGVATECLADSGSGAAAGASATCAVPAGTLNVGFTYAFELQVTDSAYSAETQTSPASSAVSVSTALAAPGTPTVSATEIDSDQALTVTASVPASGTAPYSWQWLFEVDGGAYVDSTVCGIGSGSGASAGAIETCTVAGGTLAGGISYAFELNVTDSAGSPETTTSPSSPLVNVAPALTAPSTPTVSATALDADQALTVTSTLPTTGTSPYSWQWLVSVDGGAYSGAGVCTQSSGSGAPGGATETCSIAGGTLSAGSTYTFELVVTDSAAVPESVASASSASVSVSPALAAPGTPAPSGTALDRNQALTVTGTIPTTGTGPYAWSWLVSVNDGSYVPATGCLVASGSGAVAGASVTCTIAGGTLTIGDTYSFELTVTDSATTPETGTSLASATVTIASKLAVPATPTVNRPALDANQVLNVTDKLPSSGTAPYSWQWLVAVNGGAFTDASQCALASGTGGSAGQKVACTIPANTLVGGDFYNFELAVTDSASNPETTTSAQNLETVTVAAALAPPTTPTVSATALDVNQALTVTSAIPSSGTAPYTYVWLWSINGGAYGSKTACAVGTGTDASAGAVVTCSIAAGALHAGDTYSFELKVTDSATKTTTTLSAPSPLVSVSKTLKAPAKPTVSATRLVVSQALTVTGTLPTTGTGPLAWQWVVSVNGGAYVDAAQCTVNSGTGGAFGAQVTCTIAGGTLTVGDTYSFELVVTDGATASETATSVASKTVTVVSP